MFEPKREKGWIKKRDGNYYQFGSSSLYYYPDTMQFKSYSTEVARFDTVIDSWLVTERWNTVTTNKHLNQIKDSLLNSPNGKYITVSYSGNKIEDNIKKLEEQIETLTGKYNRSKKYKNLIKKDIEKRSAVLDVLKCSLEGKVSIYKFFNGGMIYGS